MNLGELKTLVADYMHRTNLDSKIPGFIQMATERIGRNLRSQENTTTLFPYDPSTDGALPVDYRGMKEISYLTGERRIQLRGANVDVMSMYAQTGVGSQFYKVNGLYIDIVPFLSRDYRLIYYNAPAALVDDEDTNAILTAYPYLYVYGALVEAMFYIRDFQAREGAIATFASEIDELNMMSSNADTGAQMTMGG